MEKVVFPIQSSHRQTISKFLPHRDCEYDDSDTVLMKSSVVDGVDARGMGFCRNKSYNWRLAIESSNKSVAVIPDRFFDVKGRHFPINYKKPISINLPTYSNNEFSVIYHLGSPKINDMRPPAVIIIDDTTRVKKRHIKISFNGTYTDSEGNTSDKYRFIAFLEEESFIVQNYDHVYSGCVLRPCGKKFIINNGKSLTNNFVSKNTQSNVNLEEFYNSGDAIKNKIPLENNGYMTMIDNITVDYLIDPSEADYLKIIVDENNNYKAELGVKLANEDAFGGTLVNEENNQANYLSHIYWEKAPYVDVIQFKGFEMWNKFESINALIYFIITKYEQDILSIIPVTNVADSPNNFEEDYAQYQADHLEDEKLKGKLHAYVNPETMQPFEDDYWFNQGDVFYIKSLTLSTKEKKIKGNKILVEAGQFPGMYMLVGETYIRERDTGKDERMQLKFPLCKVMSEQTITLEADGDPTTFNLELEVARPENGIMMELTSYETAPRLIESEKGCFIPIDGSTEILSE